MYICGKAALAKRKDNAIAMRRPKGFKATVLAEFAGAALVDKPYRPLFQDFAARATHCFRVISDAQHYLLAALNVKTLTLSSEFKAKMGALSSAIKKQAVSAHNAPAESLMRLFRISAWYRGLFDAQLRWCFATGYGVRTQSAVLRGPHHEMS